MKNIKRSKNEEMNKKREKMKKSKARKKTKNGRKNVGKKEKRAQKVFEKNHHPRMGPKIDFSHKNCQEKS